MFSLLAESSQLKQVPFRAMLRHLSWECRCVHGKAATTTRQSVAVNCRSVSLIGVAIVFVLFSGVWNLWLGGSGECVVRDKLEWTLSAQHESVLIGDSMSELCVSAL